MLNEHYWKYLDYIPIQNEEWKPIIFNGNAMMASSVGRIQIAAGTITHGSKTTSGYSAIVIESMTVVIHRLLCMAFKPIVNPEDYQLNHIDSNKHNNAITNLEWVPERDLRDSK
jgi:hypothetical protein